MLADHAPHLRTFTIRFAPYYDVELGAVRVEAQGFRRTDRATIELWRRIPAGEEQIVAEFQVASVIDIYAEADDGSPTDAVPATWARSYRSHDASTVASEDDVPY